MLNFKEFLTETNIDTSHFLKTKEEIEGFLRHAGYTGFKVSDDLTVRLASEHQPAIEPKMLIDGYLPFQLANAYSYYIDKTLPIKSFIGSPLVVHNNVTIRINSQRSLIGCPKRVGGAILLADFKGTIKSLEGITQDAAIFRNYLYGVTSYHNVSKEIRQIDSLIEITGAVKDSLLGMLAIKGDFSIICSTDKDTSELQKAVEIINGHLLSNRDILDCNEELRAAGLKEYAKL